MTPSPTISGAEWDVMRVVWEHTPCTAREVADHLVDQKRWSDRTVKTLLGRLVKKGVLSFEAEGKRYRYFPLVTQEQCVAAESSSFLDRVFDGSASPLLAHFLQRSRLSPQEIEELRALLEDQEEGTR